MIQCTNCREKFRAAIAAHEEGHAKRSPQTPVTYIYSPTVILFYDDTINAEGETISTRVIPYEEEF